MAQNLSDNLVNLASSNRLMGSVDEDNNSNIPLFTHRSNRSGEVTVSEFATLLEADNEDEVKGAEGGTPVDVVSVTTTHHNKENKRPELPTRSSPTNPMSVSVPNLPTSMEQTVSLLESFATVAKKNLGTVGMNNRSNSIRLASQNAISKYLVCLKVRWCTLQTSNDFNIKYY